MQNMPTLGKIMKINFPIANFVSQWLIDVCHSLNVEIQDHRGKCKPNYVTLTVVKQKIGSNSSHKYIFKKIINTTYKGTWKDCWCQANQAPSFSCCASSTWHRWQPVSVHQLCLNHWRQLCGGLLSSP